MPRRLLASVAALVVVPIGVEWLIAYIKNEQYRVDRAAVVLGVLTLVLAFLWILRFMGRRLSLLLELAMVILGLVVTSTGIFSFVAPPDQRTGLSVIVVCLGLAITSVGGYAIYLEKTGIDFFFAVRKALQKGAVHHVGAGQEQTVLTKFPSFSTSDEEVANLCRSQMNADDLHFVGYYVGGDCRFHVDVLDRPALNRFFRGDDREQRREAYERAGRQLDWIMSRLNVYMRRLDGGILIRTVLDIEQGALYYYWIDRNVYLTGLTMDQSKVLVADEKLRRLANAIGHLPRGGLYPAEPSIQQVVAQGE
jgi:hypothetical protein